MKRLLRGEAGGPSEEFELFTLRINTRWKYTVLELLTRQQFWSILSSKHTLSTKTKSQQNMWLGSKRLAEEWCMQGETWMFLSTGPMGHGAPKFGGAFFLAQMLIYVTNNKETAIQHGLNCDTCVVCFPWVVDVAFPKASFQMEIERNISAALGNSTLCVSLWCHLNSSFHSLLNSPSGDPWSAFCVLCVWFFCKVHVSNFGRVSSPDILLFS